jgi:hypothetical protein
MRNGDGTINGNASVEGRTVIYMNRTVLEALDATGTNSFERRADAQADGARRPHGQSYRGIPIEVTDAILNTEALVS